jgi:hypothetical protein
VRSSSSHRRRRQEAPRSLQQPLYARLQNNAPSVAILDYSVGGLGGCADHNNASDRRGSLAADRRLYHGRARVVAILCTVGAFPPSPAIADSHPKSDSGVGLRPSGGAVPGRHLGSDALRRGPRLVTFSATWTEIPEGWSTKGTVGHATGP